MTRPGPRPRPVEDRFWEKVDKGGECWLWTAHVDKHGYGEFNLGPRRVRAHRYAYELVVGPTEQELDHRHTCPKVCVTPRHLRPATRKQNQENRPGPQRNSTSGVRGVSWHKAAQKWRVAVKHNQRNYHGGLFVNIEDAEAAAISLRTKLFTHNDADRNTYAATA